MHDPCRRDQCPNTRRPAFHVPSTTPSSARPSNGVFCALPGRRPASTCQIALRVEQAEIRRPALGQRPASTPSSAAGRAVSSSIACARVSAAVVHLRQRHAEQGGKPGAARRRLGERLALVVGIARLVVRGDRVDRAVGQCGHHRQPVRLLAQRRRQLGIGAEVADRRLVEVEIGRRGVAGHREPVGLRLADQRQRLGGGDMGEMHRPAGQRRQADVAGDQDRLGGGRDAGQAEPGGQFALGRGAAVGERRVLGMLHDACAEAAGVGQREAHQPRRPMARLPSVKATAPASASRPSSASSSPRQPVVTAP